MNESDNQDKFSELNKPDIRGVHKYRFKWKNLVNKPPENIHQIWLKMENKRPKFYFEVTTEEKDVTAHREILNVKILSYLEGLGKKFKVMGARGRNIIIGAVSLKQFGVRKDELLILSSLKDWRQYNRLYSE